MLKYGVRNAFRNAFWPSVFGTFLLPWKLSASRGSSQGLGAPPEAPDQSLEK